jgi:beta-lactam-binding protein with PASTA domain
VAVLLAAFGVGMAGVVYMSLSGSEMKVPDIVGKDLVESEKELAALGLKIKKRADRVSPEKMNTVLEQLPKAGETVKTGQMILVVVSKAGEAGEEAPSSLKKDLEEDDTKKIEEMISDKPQKPKANSNSKKKADTTRDVNANTATSVPNSDSDIDAAPKAENDSKKEPGTTEKPSKTPEKNEAKPQSTPNTVKPVKPAFPRPGAKP